MPETVLEGTHAVIMAAHFDPTSRRIIGASWTGPVRGSPAEDYAKRADQRLARRQDGELDVGKATGGFKRTQDGTTSEYDGLIYVFSRQREAEEALETMMTTATLKKVLGEHPGGIHVMYLHSDGTLGRLTPLPESIAP